MMGNMNQTPPSELSDILAHLMVLHPASRDDLKSLLTDLLQDRDLVINDTHNTSSMIFIFRAGKHHYGLKIEYGAAVVTRDEAHWYELAPAELKSHYVISHMADDYAFVLLRWLDEAKTIETIAIDNEGNPDNPTIELVLAALKQDRALFDANQTVPLLNGKGQDYFYDKYRSYNAKADQYPYLESLINNDTVRLNGRDLPGPERIVQMVQQNDKLREYLAPDTAGLIQGDLHMDNILVEDGRVYFIDPKGVDHLPLEYDTGRVIWSLTGWNAIVNGEYELTQDDEGYHLNVTVRQQYADGMPQIQAYFTEQEYHRARYSAAMQYLTRISHAEVESEATALYLRGLEVFADLLDELGIEA